MVWQKSTLSRATSLSNRHIYFNNKQQIFKLFSFISLGICSCLSRSRRRLRKRASRPRLMPGVFSRRPRRNGGWLKNSRQTKMKWRWSSALPKVCFFFSIVLLRSLFYSFHIILILARIQVLETMGSDGAVSVRKQTESLTEQLKKVCRNSYQTQQWQFRNKCFCFAVEAARGQVAPRFAARAPGEIGAGATQRRAA